jgi:outer membrane receptor protein involved in Fe transport
VVFDRVALDPARATTVRIRNVAHLTGTAGVDYDDLRRFSGRLGARYVGRRLDSDFSDPADPGDIEYAPFLVVDLTAGVRLGGRYSLDGQVSNLTDENYYEKRGYNLPGRAVRLRVSANF